jgi:uncharacterized protein (TIGR03437 family)
VSLRLIYFPLALLLAVRAAAQVPVVPTLTPKPALLSFTWVAGGALPAAQTISVKAGSSIVAYTTALAPLGTQWITVTPGSGVLPAALSVLVNPSALPVGIYTVVIQFSATGLTSISIPVSLTVQAPPATLVLSSSSLSFTTPPHIPGTQTVTLTTTGGPVTFNAASSAPWMTVTPTSAVVLPGFAITLTVAVTDAGILPSAIAYSGKITILASNVPSTNATQTITVAMLVNALTPTVTALYPSAALMGSGPLTLTVTGTGFYKGGTTATSGATPLATPTYVNPTTILVVLPASLLATAGTINVSVVNPTPGGISLAPAVFTVSPTPVVQAVVSAASYAGGPISPGDFVTLFGTAIGPAAPAGMSVVGGYAATTVGGVSVTIDGVSAPIIYVSLNQLTVQVPYTASVGTGKVVIVTNTGVAEPFAPNVTIAAAAPGLFLDAGVVGQCAALRFAAATGAYSVNSTTSAALVGDTVVFYLTGEGFYDLATAATSGYVVPATPTALTLQTGQTSWPQLSPLPTVTIGGIAATVTYAGVVPGGLLGLLQINVLVPAGSTTVKDAPVLITIGAASTQVGATIAVK